MAQVSMSSPRISLRSHRSSQLQCSGFPPKFKLMTALYGVGLIAPVWDLKITVDIKAVSLNGDSVTLNILSVPQM